MAAVWRLVAGSRACLAAPRALRCRGLGPAFRSLASEGAPPGTSAPLAVPAAAPPADAVDSEGKTKKKFYRERLLDGEEEVLTEEEKKEKDSIIKELTRRLSGPLADEDGNVPTGSDRPIAIEVDGPSHFYANSKRYTAYSKLKHRLLTRMGYKVLHVPYFEWRRLRGAREREDYMRGKLQEEPTEWLDPEDEKYYSQDPPDDDEEFSVEPPHTPPPPPTSAGSQASDPPTPPGRRDPSRQPPPAAAAGRSPPPKGGQQAAVETPPMPPTPPPPPPRPPVLEGLDAVERRPRGSARPPPPPPRRGAADGAPRKSPPEAVDFPPPPLK